MKRPFLSIALICFATLTAPRAALALDSEFQAWSAVFVQVAPQAAPGLDLWLDTHARRGSGSTTVIVRPGIGYRFMPSFVVHAGYGWVPVFADSGSTDHEHRAWQQFIWAPKLAESLLVNVRGRFEQRVADAGDDVGLRLRLFLRGNWRFGQSPYVLALWDELFFPVNTTDWGQSAGFGQNRAFLGVGLIGFEGMRLEVGYLNVFVNRAVDQLNHALALNLFLRY